MVGTRSDFMSLKVFSFCSPTNDGYGLTVKSCCQKIAKTKNANTRRLRYFTLLMDGEIVAVVVTYIHS